MSNQDLNGSGSKGNLNSSNSFFNNTSSTTGATEIDAKKLSRLLYSYKWMTVCVIIATVAAMYFYVNSVIPIYQGEGTMIISQNENSYASTGSDMNSMLTSSFGIGRGRTIANELAILRSRNFAEVIADKILESPIQPDGRLHPLLWRTYPEDASMVGRDVLASRVQGRLTTAPVEDELQSDMILITFNSPSSHEAATVTNMVLDSYTQFSSDQNREQVRSAISYLNQEMATVQETLNEKEEKLRDFMNREKLVELDSQTHELITAISNIENERQAASVQEVAARSAIKSYQEELNNIKPGFAQKYAEGLSTKLNRYQFSLAELETERMLMIQRNPSLENNPELEPSLQRLNKQITELKAEITELAGDFIENDDNALSFLGSPDGDMIARVTEISQQLLVHELDAQQYAAQIEVLDQRLEEYQSTFDDLPDNMIEFARLTRDVEVNEQLYLNISGQSSELAVWEQTQSSPGRVVDYSEVPDIPVEPKTQLLLIWSFVIGCMLSFGLVYIREMTSTRINSIEKLMQKKYTILSVIPDITINKAKLFGKKRLIEAGDHFISSDLITVLDPMSYASEAYRRLLSNIMFSQTDKSYKSILVTSANKAEGKSSMIANLAAVYAETGKSVALVDCDFRQSTQYKLWGLPASPGSADVLSEKISLERVIQPTVVDNIHVISTGKAPGNPAEMVQSRNMKEMIDKLKGIYDVVLIDSPPFGFITDAAPLMQYIDGVVLVTRFNQSKEPELEQCLGNLRNVNANIIGTVMTSFNHKKAAGYNLETSHFKNAFENYNRYNGKEVKKKKVRKY
ncbi:MAG: polysaccharide biosynthesis tyrosine autokinase [Balneolales bacterium]